MQRLIGKIITGTDELFSAETYSRGRAVKNNKNIPDLLISDEDIDADFEYNFDLNPFNYLLEGLHKLIVLVFSLLSKDKKWSDVNYGNDR